MRKRVYWVILIIFTYTLVELCSYGGLYLAEKYGRTKYEPVDELSQEHYDIIKDFIKQKTNYFVFSSTLGWSIKENGHSELYQANSQGIRSDKEYAFTPPKGVLRVSTFGDSYTHCDDVTNKDTWQAVIEGYNPHIEVLNFGVGGYGLGQAYLRYVQDGSKFKSHITFIGYTPENIYRNVNTFRPFYIPYTEMPLAKPRFLLVNNTLSLVPNYFNEIHEYNTLLQHPKDVLSQLGIHDYYFKRRYRSGIFDWSPTVRTVKIVMGRINSYKNGIETDEYYDTNSEAFIVTKKIFDTFHREIINNGSIPIIVIFPRESDVERYQKDKTKRYTPLLSYFDSMGYRYIDMTDAFEHTDIDDVFIRHYSPAGDRLIAEYIYTTLTYYIDHKEIWQ